MFAKSQGNGAMSTGGSFLGGQAGAAPTLMKMAQSGGQFGPGRAGGMFQQSGVDYLKQMGQQNGFDGGSTIGLLGSMMQAPGQAMGAGGGSMWGNTGETGDAFRKMMGTTEEENPIRQYLRMLAGNGGMSA